MPAAVSKVTWSKFTWSAQNRWVKQGGVRENSIWMLKTGLTGGGGSDESAGQRADEGG